MLKVGITGSIGSGKTTVCQIFSILGIPVYYADDRAKWLMNENPSIKKAIIDLLGQDAYSANQELNRSYVASKVFNDAEKLQALNQIVHPAVAEDGQSWQEEQKNTPYTLKEAALLFEAGSYKQLDKIICVVAEEDLRIKRVMSRDEVSAEEVKARMDKQWSQHKKMLESDFLIYNDGQHSLIKQVLHIHKRFLKLGG